MQIKRKSVSASTNRLFEHVCGSCLFAEFAFPHNLRDNKKFYGRDKELSEMKRQLVGDNDRFSSLSHAVKFCLLVTRQLQYKSISFQC